MHRAILAAAVFLMGLIFAAGPTASLALENSGSGVSKTQSGTRGPKSHKAKRPQAKPGKG